MPAILSLVMVVIVMGIVALFRQWGTSEQRPAFPAVSTASAQEFLLYRNALVQYLEANAAIPAASSAIAGQLITFPPGVNAASMEASANNYVVLGANGLRTIYVWAPAQLGEIAAFNKILPGDLSVGIVNASGTNWSSEAGGTMGAVPNYVPAGDIVSIVSLGGG